MAVVDEGQTKPFGHQDSRQQSVQVIRPDTSRAPRPAQEEQRHPNLQRSIKKRTSVETQRQPMGRKCLRGICRGWQAPTDELGFEAHGRQGPACFQYPLVMRQIVGNQDPNLSPPLTHAPGRIDSYTSLSLRLVYSGKSPRIIQP